MDNKGLVGGTVPPCPLPWGMKALSISSRQKKYSYFIWSCLAFAVFLWYSLGLVGEVGAVSPQRKHPNKKTIQQPSCDFKVEIKETDFYVVEGEVHDIAVALIPTVGVCKGSATMSISGLPTGATYKIFPSPKMTFIRSPKMPTGIAVATVRIDTASMTLEEMATSSLIFTASKKSLIRKAKSDMTINLPNEDTVQESSCDFKVEIKEADFCVIKGSVRDIDVTLTPTAGVCKGSATISVSGLPQGVTKEILPSPKVMFTRDATAPTGIAVATVRIHTAGITLEEMATSSVTFVAVQKGLTRTAKADMTIDMPSFDFLLVPSQAQLKMHVDDEDPPSSVDVKVKLLGAGCRSAPPVTFKVDADSLPPVIGYQLSDESTIPPSKVTVSLKASSKPGSPSEIGYFGIILAGCCTEEGLEKTMQITVDAGLPKLPDVASMISLEGDGEGPDLKAFMQMTDGKRFAVDTLENILKMAHLPKEAIEEAKKHEEDLATKGYIETTEEAVNELKRVRARARPIEEVRDMLTFEPVSLKNNPFEKYYMVGGDPSGVYRDGKWMTVDRIFDMPNGTLIKFTEDDPFSSGTTIIAKESINEYVNNYPATLVVLQSPSGKAFTEMHWITQTTKYALTMEGNVKKNGQYQLFLELARSIPITSSNNDNDSKTTNTTSSTQELISNTSHDGP